ncbi:MAG: hypothetical protein LBU36_02525 [Clostridiales bacterium]|jgi:phosphopantothenate-cysteine ligase|nr:hypothetical protein [Clostridiales bacterium]
MNALVTSGGTIEPIDSVRGITNFSTGALGALIAENLTALGCSVLYVAPKTAAAPKQPCETLTVTDAASVEAAIKARAPRMDIIIHAMAVSDYRVAGASSVPSMSREIAKKISALGGADEKIIADAVKTLFHAEKKGKIPSGLDDLTLLLEQTPKIIALLRSLAPNAVIAGFKLLSGVTREALIDVARALMRKSGADFMVANDMSNITETAHIAHIISKAAAACEPETFGTKIETARALSQKTFDLAAKRKEK